ncbi:MAG: alpha-ketoglutarate-dependent dioxygenase AlkB [Steroidobacteraceae bacterium]
MPTANLPLPSTEAQRFDLPDAEVRLWPQALSPDEADGWFSALRSRIDWQQEEILIFGERRRVPRLVAWYGDPGTTYTYSGTAHEPLPWTVELQSIRARVEAVSGYRYNSVLLNRYRDGRDGMGWHADDEPELGLNPVIASVSLGATRRFCLRHRRHKDRKLDLLLPHGSLLCMGGTTQHHWVHALPKTRLPVGERINLTFRLLVPQQVSGMPAATRNKDH